MNIATYTDLKAAVADWLNRDDVSDARLGDFVAMAENRIFKQLRIKELEAAASLTIDSQGRATFPADHLEPKDVLWADKPLARVSLTQYYSQSPVQGTPVCFSREGNYIKFWPTPVEAATDGRLIYYARPTDLSSNQSSNAIFALAPELYLFGALIAGGTYLGMPQDRISLWSASFDEALNSLIKQSRQSDVSGATMLVESGY